MAVASSFYLTMTQTLQKWISVVANKPFSVTPAYDLSLLLFLFLFF